MAFSFDHKTGSSYTLTIFLESPMRAGSCYLGLEETTGKIFRLRDPHGRFVWPGFPLFTVGKRYIFFKADTEYVSPFCEDICVLPSSTRCVETEGDDSITEPIFEKLLLRAHPSVEGVFNFQVKGCKYINEGCKCPAFGIWEYSGGGIDIYEQSDDYRDQQKRISLGGYDFPYKGYFPCAKIERRETDTPLLVVVGLSEPFAGSEDNIFNPRRCYIMVFGILFNEFEQSKASAET